MAKEVKAIGKMNKKGMTIKFSSNGKVKTVRIGKPISKNPAFKRKHGPRVSPSNPPTPMKKLVRGGKKALKVAGTVLRKALLKI